MQSCDSLSSSPHGRARARVDAPYPILHFHSFLGCFVSAPQSELVGSTISSSLAKSREARLPRSAPRADVARGTQPARKPLTASPDSPSSARRSTARVCGIVLMAQKRSTPATVRSSALSGLSSRYSILASTTEALRPGQCLPDRSPGAHSTRRSRRRPLIEAQDVGLLQRCPSLVATIR